MYFTFEGSSSPDAISTVAAPIEEPCNIIVAFLFSSIIKLIQFCKSSFSNHPIPKYSPSLSPHARILGINTLYPFFENCSPIGNTLSVLALYPCNIIAHLFVCWSCKYSVPFNVMPSFAFTSTVFCIAPSLHFCALSFAVFLLFSIIFSSSPCISIFVSSLTFLSPPAPLLAIA